jgi:hypothetical protein
MFGNVGIGTTSPGNKLQVVGANNIWTGLFLGSATASQSFGISIQAGTDVNDVPLIVRNHNASVEFMRIVGNGNVGIGTASPTTKLDIAGTVKADLLSVTSVNPIYLPTIQGDTGTTLVVRADGYVNKLASSARYKDNIHDWLLDAKDQQKFLSLSPKMFNYKNGGTRNVVSFIAEESDATGLPSLVNYNSDGLPESLRDYSFIAMHHLVLQNHEKRIETTEALTGQLADQNLTVDNKLQLIGQNLDNIQTQIVASLQAQITVQKSDMLELQKQMVDIELQNKDFNEFLLAFDVKNIDNFAKLNAPISTFTGQLEAQSLVAGAFSVRVVDQDAPTIGDSIICEENKALKDGACVVYDSEDAELLEADGKSVLIKTTAINTDSKVYITPISSTNNQVIYVGEIKLGKSFEVKVDNLVGAEIKFNWWIVDEK